MHRAHSIPTVSIKRIHTPKRKILIVQQPPNTKSGQYKHNAVQATFGNGVFLSSRGISFSSSARMQLAKQIEHKPDGSNIKNEEINSFDEQAQHYLSQYPPKTLEVSNQIEKSLQEGKAPPVSVDTMESLAFKLAIQKHTQNILILIEKLESINSPLATPTIYASAVVSLLLGGKFESAQQLYENYVVNKHVTFDLKSSNILIKMFGMKSQLGAAVKVFKAMKKNNISPNIDTYNTLTNIYAHKGTPAKVTECIDKMKKAGIQPNHETFKLLVSHYAFRKNMTQAMKYLQEFIQYDSEHNLENSASVVSAFNSLLVVHTRNGDTTELIKVYDEIKKQGYTPNRSTMTIMVTYFLDRKELLPAIKYYFIMKGYGFTTHDMVKYFYRRFKKDTVVPASTLHMWKSILPNRHSLIHTTIDAEGLNKFEESLNALQHQ